VKTKGGKNTGDLNGFLDAGCRIQGELHFEDTFRVDGSLSGKAVSEGDLIVGTGGEVDGEIRVGRLFVSGTARGNIKATRRVEIAVGAVVLADLVTPSLLIEDGAEFHGKCSMGGKVEEKPVSNASPQASYSESGRLKDKTPGRATRVS
jgi:cytoskeletal protein CcmA (bactofilin family)